MPSFIRATRLRIHDGSAATLASFRAGAGGGATGAALVVTSLPSTDPADASYIAEGHEPSGDGQTVDVLTGAVDLGEYTVGFIDADVGGGVRIGSSALVDASYRWQLTGRAAQIEESLDAGGSWTVLAAGYLTRLTLSDALLLEATVGDARRTDETTELFVRAEGSFDLASNIIGTPVRGGWGPIPDLGGWKFTVGGINLGQDVDLDFVEGHVNATLVDLGNRSGFARVMYGSSYFKKVTSLGAARDVINTVTAPYGQITSTSLATGIVGRLDGLRARVENATTGALIGYFTPLIYKDALFRSYDDLGLLARGDHLWLDVVGEDASGNTVVWAPTVGTQVEVYVYPLAISERNPVHLAGHPVDLVTTAWTDAGIPWDATEAAATKAAIGSGTWVEPRYTQRQTLREFTESLFHAFRFAWRMGDDGERELFPLDELGASVLTVTLNELRGGGGNAAGNAAGDDDQPAPWDADDATVVNRVVVEGERFTLWDPEDDSWPFDVIEATPDSYTVDPSDPLEQEHYGVHEWRVRFPGRRVRRMALFGVSFSVPMSVQAWATALAQALFPRYLRGAPGGTIKTLRGSDARLGQTITLDLPHYPQNGTRGGQRLVQIVARTLEASGPVLGYVDAGSATTPAVVPTFTLAALASDPQHVAEGTLTNAAALTAAGVTTVRVEWETGTSAPTGGQPLTTFDPASVTTAQSPQVGAGETVWMRMRAEIPGQAPGAWSAWQSVTLTALNPPTGLTATQTSPGVFDLAWTVGEPTLEVEVFVRLATEAAFLPQHSRIILPAGSTQYQVTGVVAASVAGVRHIEPAPLSGASATASVALTPSGTTPTLLTPGNPQAWAGTLGAGGIIQIDGSYGLEVTALEWPTWIVFEVAEETVPGAGAFGSYSVYGTVPAVQGAATRSPTLFAPNDGKLRSLRAKATAPAYNDSPYTTPVSIDPWQPQAPTTISDAEVVLSQPSGFFPNGRVAVDSADITWDRTVAAQIAALLTPTGVTPGTYGDATNVPQVTVDAKGRITAISNIPGSALPAGVAGDIAIHNGAAWVTLSRPSDYATTYYLLTLSPTTGLPTWAPHTGIVAPVASVVLTPDTLAQTVGDVDAVVVRTYDSNGVELTGRVVDVSSSAPGVATVSPASGLSPFTFNVSAAGLGTATITADSEGQTDTCAVDVTAAATPSDVPPLVTALGGASEVLAFYDARAGIGLTGTAVTQWDDARGASGFGPALTASAGSAPAWDAANEILTSPGGRALSSASLALFDLSGGISIVVVGAFGTAGSGFQQDLAGITDNSTRVLALRGNAGNIGAAAGDIAYPGNQKAASSGVARHATTRRLMVASVDGSTPNTTTAIEVRDQAANAGGTSGSASGALASGANLLRVFGSISSYTASGQIRAVIVVGHRLSAGEIDAIETWASTYHGITLA